MLSSEFYLHTTLEHPHGLVFSWSELATRKKKRETKLQYVVSVVQLKQRSGKKDKKEGGKKCPAKIEEPRPQSPAMAGSRTVP